MPLKSFEQIGKGRDLSAEEQGEFYKAMKCSIWLLKVGVGSHMKVACGVCINESGHILTSSKVTGKIDDPVQGREVGSSNFQKLDTIKHGASLLLLQATVKKKKYDYAVVTDDSSAIMDCQEIYSIFHEERGIYSFAVGEISHRRRVDAEGIQHFQVTNVHRKGASDVIFSSTGHILGIVVPTSGPVDENNHNLVLHFSEINRFLKSYRTSGSRSRKR